MSTAAAMIPARERPGRFAGARDFARRFARRRDGVLGLVILTFFVVRLMPGSPVDAYIAKQIGEFGISYIDAAAQAESLFAINPSEPLYQQYFTYLGRIVQGNLGKSLVSRMRGILDPSSLKKAPIVKKAG